jgi:hypothetical protein
VDALIERLRNADMRGVSPPQSWTTEAADELDVTDDGGLCPAQGVFECGEGRHLRGQMHDRHGQSGLSEY